MGVVRVVDTTLRDGEQAPGVVFTPAQRAELAGLLAQAGVAEIEVGIPAMGEREIRAIRAIARLHLRAPLIGWARATEGDVEAAARSDVPFLHIGFPASDRQLQLTGRTREGVLVEIELLLGRALPLFDGVSVGSIDATRADPAFLVEMASAARDGGARRFRLADTVGTGHPFGVFALVERIRAAVPEIELEFHGHDDLGLATANTLAAVQAGAGAVSVTVNGLGERAGNAPLEQVVLALELHRLGDTGLDLPRLAALCERVAELSGRPLPASQPVVGAQVFTHESGIHVAGLLRDPLAFQPFAPELVGAPETAIVVGKHTGRAAVLHVLRGRGVEPDLGLVDELVSEVRRIAERAGRSLEPAELEDLYACLQDPGGADRRRLPEALR